MSLENESLENESLEKEMELIKGIARHHGIDLDSVDDLCLIFSTREHGDVSEDEPSLQDIKNAQSMRKAIIEQLPIAKVSIDTCDEWVIIEVSLDGLVEEDGLSSYNSNGIML